jgi:hypothetical protein
LLQIEARKSGKNFRVVFGGKQLFFLTALGVFFHFFDDVLFVTAKNLPFFL